MDVSKTLREIMAQEAKLRERKEACRLEAIKTVNNLIAAFGLKAKELNFEAGVVATPAAEKPVKAAKKPVQKVKPKYCSPDGVLWTGRGRKPVAIQKALDEGVTLEDMLIEKSEA